jgi:NAD(P)-dependent dehydrogenase (short-subunit alcohol dehydrogenase family)|tara:strand:- start:104 stop:844 length:741 start_codon:yes stop_codon:yes gene_type:complete
MTNRKSVLITGASGDIGQSLCQGFKELDWKVIATDTNRIQSINADHFIEMDLDLICNDDIYCDGKVENIKKLISGELTTLINNAALQIVKPAKEIALQDWQKSLNINLTAPFILSMKLLDELKAAKGSIINISSIHAKLTKPNFSAYSVSKAGLSGLTKSLAVEIGDRVRVNSISPAAINTQMLRKSFIDNLSGLNKLQDYHPSKIIGTTTNVLDAAIYLANGDKFVNGMEIRLDGGISSRLHDPN